MTERRDPQLERGFGRELKAEGPETLETLKWIFEAGVCKTAILYGEIPSFSVSDV